MRSAFAQYRQDVTSTLRVKGSGGYSNGIEMGARQAWYPSFDNRAGGAYLGARTSGSAEAAYGILTAFT